MVVEGCTFDGHGGGIQRTEQMHPDLPNFLY